MGGLLEPGKNSIGFMRLALASMVLFGHGYELAGYKGDANRWGVLAVLGFFSLSGMLVAASFERSKGWMDFARKRFLRIYPGLWVNLLVTAFVLVPAVWIWSHGSLSGYFAGDASPWYYVWRTAPIIDGFVADIRHVFAANPFPIAVNGSLWTLPVEVICYVALGVLASFGALRRPILSLLLAVGLSALWTLHINFHAPRAIQKLFDPQVIELYAAFAIGVTAYLYRDRIKIIPWLGWLCLAFCALVLWSGLGTAGDALRPFVTAYAVLWLAAVLPFTQFDRKTDISYGVYIYAFPITQCLIFLGVSRSSPPLFFFLIAILTAALAYASWHLVERQALKMKKKSSAKLRKTPEEQPAPASG